MSEVSSTTDATSQPPSLTPVESTRTTTPTGASDIEESEQTMTPKFNEQVSALEDVPMMDISPGKHDRSPSPKKLETAGEALSPQLESLKLPSTGDVPRGDLTTDSCYR